MKGYKKIDYNQCLEEKFEMKHYFKTLNIQEAHLCYKIKYFLVPTVSLNFKNDKTFRAQNYLCQDCLTEELAEDGKSTTTLGFQNSQDHLVYECSANEDLKEGKSLDRTQDLVLFFKQILERRQEKLQ